MLRQVKLDWNCCQDFCILQDTTSSQSVCSNQIRCMIILANMTQGESQPAGSNNFAMSDKIHVLYMRIFQ